MPTAGKSSAVEPASKAIARRSDGSYNTTMSLTLDRFGFPHLRLKSGGAVGLFPLLKVQFEWLHGRVGGPELFDYGTCLALNPRGSWRGTAKLANLDPLVLTGLLPEEAATIAAALGDRRLPSPSEWREADTALDVPCSREACDKVLKLPTLHPAAASILQRPQAKRWRDFGAGYLEWVQSTDGFGLYGDPRPDFQLNWLSNRKQPSPMVPRNIERHRGHTVRLFWNAAAEGRPR